MFPWVFKLSGIYWIIHW